MIKKFSGDLDNKKRLPELLKEFREALEAEISAAKKKASSSAVPLSNGKRIAQDASQHQYVFTIDSILNTPEGSPAELIIQGKPSVDAAIISVEELRITLSVKSDIGDFIPFARLQSDLSILLKKLIERIEDNSENENVVGMRMLGRSTIDGALETISFLENENFNSNQKTAIASAIGRNMTFIWGPPGTGKTNTIGKIINELYKRNRTVLLVSHTNIAVDQALLKSVKSIEKQDVENGCILRLGVPKNPELTENYPQVTMEYQRALRAKELEIQLKDKTNNLDITNSDIEKLYWQIADYKWYCDYAEERDDLFSALESYEQECLEQAHLNALINNFNTEKEQLSSYITIAKDYLRLQNNNEKYQEKYNKEISNKDVVCEELDKLNSEMEQIKILENQCQRQAEIKKELSQRVSSSTQKQILGRIEKEINIIQTDIDKKSSDLLKTKELLTTAKQTNIIRRAIKGIPSPERLLKDFEIIENMLNALNKDLRSKNVEYGRQYSIYQKTSNLQNELQSIAPLSFKDIEKQYNNILGRIEKCDEKIKASEERIRKLNEQISETERKLLEIENEFSGEIKEIVSNYFQLQASLDKCIEESKVLTRSIDSKKAFIKTTLERINLHWTQNDLNFCPEDNYRDYIESLDTYHDSLIDEFSDFNIHDIQEYICLLEDTTKELMIAIEEIKNKLAEIEKEIIAEAKIIGTTLTKAYLSDELQVRKFDTIILDEASMAPIPTLWASTLLADNNVIIVGDFKQLPPIVLSDTEIAKKWIGRDIFEESGVKEEYEKKCPPDYFIILNEQYRMERKIAEIANRYYDGELKSPDSIDRKREKAEFDDWCNDGFLPDNPVVLVNTESLNVWVTSVSKGNQSSRLNFLSAALSVNLAERLISNYSLDNSKEKKSKILIISPYRPHTKLIDILLKDSKLEDELVRAGTIHSFQGSEADIVIFDLVVDEPHFRVNLFMNSPEIREQMRRLFNVGITRAKFKLLIIGDFKYCLSKGKNSELADLLNDLITKKKFPLVDAKQIVPKLHELSQKAQKTVVGGKIETIEERLVVNQESFYKYLSDDLERAKNEIVIYSPFITKDRMSYLKPQLQAAIERGVTVFIITKSLQERNKSEIATYRELEEHISEVGIVLIHKMRMHEKMVFIDEDIVWTGSLNPLSFSSTKEIMERRYNKDVQKDYKEVLRLSELINYINKPESKCPICGLEMIAAEGKDAPYYWRCVNDNCFTRGIDQNYPMNGELTCASCGGSVDFGYWGEEPCWRCLKNKRHHMKLYRSHLKLPKMEKKIPKRELKKVSKYLDETYLQKSITRQEKTDTLNKQISLFED